MCCDGVMSGPGIACTFRLIGIIRSSGLHVQCGSSGKSLREWGHWEKAGLMLPEVKNVWKNSGRRTLTRGHQCATWFIPVPQLLMHLFLLFQFYAFFPDICFPFLSNLFSLFFFRPFSFLPFYLPAMKEEIVPFCKQNTHKCVNRTLWLGTVLTRRPISNLWQQT